MNISGLLATFALSFGLLMIAMTVHEFAHGWVAYRSGDPSAKYSGRLTLNPLAHIDPFWTLLLPLLLFVTTSGHFVFGAAKPVPINYHALRDPKKDIVWIGLSGPLANFILAFFLSIALRVFSLPPAVNLVISTLIAINVVLGVFNLIPLPPLDGSRIIMGLLPEPLSRKYSLIEPYGFILVIGLLWLGVFDRVVWPLVNFLLQLMGVSA